MFTVEQEENWLRPLPQGANSVDNSPTGRQLRRLFKGLIAGVLALAG